MTDPCPGIFSKHNILGKIKDSVDYFLINILTRSADILDEETAIKLKNGLFPQKDDLEKKGYLMNSEDEKILFINSYCETSDEKEKSTILIHFIPWLACNLSCNFCPYENSVNKNRIVSDILIKDFFIYIDKYMADRNKILAISGGEPLLLDNKYKKVISQIFHEAGSRSLPVRIKTNGYYLKSYLPFLQNQKIEGIHIFIDFQQTPFANESPVKDMNEYFKKLVAGINVSLESGIKTHMKIIIDNAGIEKIHLFASYAEKMGWIYNAFFSVDIISKRNILSCDTMNILFPYPPDMIDAIYNHVLNYPEILELYRPHLSVTRYLLEKKHLPLPLFKACPGGVSELVCRFDGHIFPCIAVMMKEDECLGTFYPGVTIHTNTITAWEERDITTIKKCGNCSVQLGCGGGCTIAAKENSGTYLAPHCIPVKQFLETGLSLYFDKQLISE